MKDVIVRGLHIDGVHPRICVPATGKSEQEIVKDIRRGAAGPADLVEWRADFFDGLCDKTALERAMRVVREAAGNLPCIFTIRTAAEGGMADIAAEKYFDLVDMAISSGCFDIVDMEYERGKERVSALAKKAAACGVAALFSYHDFHSTPAKEEIVKRLAEMEALGADIAKTALMPADFDDVLCLLSATKKASKTMNIPVVTMSMSQTGIISRLLGGVTHSAITFGTAGNSSAPGQPDANELRAVLDMLEKIVK